MKPLLVFARIVIVGCLWSIVFIEGIRVIMLCNWHFDIFWPDHWRQFFDLWKAGWEISAPKEWAFIIILVTFFPMLITGWWTLCLVSWENIIADILMFPVKLYRKFIKAPINVITTNNKYGVVKRKSYKQIRPLGIGHSHTPISDYSSSQIETQQAAPALAYTPATSVSSSIAAATSRVAAKTQKTDIPAAIDHALFKFDDDDDDFDLDIDSFEKTDVLAARGSNVARKDYDEDDDEEFERKPKSSSRSKRKSETFEFGDDDFEEDSRPKKTRREERSATSAKKSRSDERKSSRAQEANSEGGSGPVYDVLRQKGYDIINNITVDDTLIDFVGVSDSRICLCLIDKETGDWLADEELFNGEDPLWFSEDSHRISPVRKISVAKEKIAQLLAQNDIDLNVVPFVVIQMANIINADDMFEVWSDMNVEVTRINRGAPKEIRLLSKTLSEADGTLSKKEFDNLRRLLKSIK